MTTQTTVYIIRLLVIYLLVYIANVETVIPDYCLSPLNTSDCNLKPTAVFTYYRTGSRCEIEYWRGCPTFNKFDNEFDCSDLCIFRFVIPDYCLSPLNTSDCNLKPKAVFTYYRTGSRCEIEYWRGCPTFNKFDNEFDCSDMCIFRFGRHAEENAIEEPTSESNLFIKLMQIPKENLTVIDEIIKEMEEEVMKIEFHPQNTEPDSVHTTTTEIPAELTTDKSEEGHEETTTTDASSEHEEEEIEELDESGLPEEVETP